MNTTEKRKIDDVMVKQISKAVEDYRGDRKTQFANIVHKLEKNPPKAVITLEKEMLALRKRKDAIEEEMKGLGFKMGDYDDHAEIDITRSYRYRESDTKEYFAKELIEHNIETENKVKSLEALGQTYTLKIYASGEEVLNILTSFQEEIAKLLK